MDTAPDRLIFGTVAERLQAGSHVRAFGEVALSALTLAVPPVEHLPHILRRTYKEQPLPLQPPVVHEQERVAHLVADSPDMTTAALDSIQLTRFVSTMLQFSDYTPVARAMATPYGNIQPLHDKIVETAEMTGPVSYSGQLSIALSETDHLPSALWNLFLTSRQYARWRDTGAITSFPDMPHAQKLQEMLAWERSLAAVKQGDERGFQDAAGDAYYVWTHALAKVIYTALPESASRLSHFYDRAFSYGSHVMSASYKLGTISVIGTMSNHIPASRYGNALGEVLADRISQIS